MFDIRGETLFFAGERLAQFLPVRVVGYRIAAENALLDWQDPDGLVTEEEHLTALEKAEKTSYDEGHVAGVEKGREEASDDAELEAQEREKQGYANGKADALCDMERAQDAQRVAALLAELKKAYNALLIFQGIQQSGAYRKRPAKLSECKKAMQAAASTLRLALNTYERPNGA